MPPDLEAKLNWFSAESIISSLGQWAVWGVAILIFLETSTIIGSILPGDSLLFLLGLSLGSSVAHYNLPLALLILVVAAVAGSQVGFWFGKRVGRKYFLKREGLIINSRNLARTEHLFANYGTRAILLARFVPVLRALVPMFAGIGDLSPKRYFILNLVSGIIWAGGVTLLGFLMGNWDWVRQNFELCVLGFVILSSLPLPMEYLRHRLVSRTNS